MKAITVYQSTDGKIFDTEAECSAHERKQAVTMAMYEKFGSRDVDYDDLYDWVRANLEIFQ